MFWNKTKPTRAYPSEPQLGDLARDKITGFTGVVECVSYWLNSCRRVTLQPIEMKDGLPVSNKTFDGPQVEVIEAGYYEKPKFRSGEKTGGPGFPPESRIDPV